MLNIPLHGNGNNEERRIKKPRTVRRSTRSCAECKRRKVRCELSTNQSLKVCSGCSQRGIPCITQDGGGLGKSAQSSKIDERLGRVETLLEKLVEKEKSQESDDRQLSSSPEDGRELLPQLSSNASNFHESGHILSLFDNSVVGRRETGDPSQSPGLDKDSGTGKISSNTGSSKLGKIRQTLCALLPTQQDADLIAESTNGWMFHVLCTTTNDFYRKDEPIAAFNLGAVAEKEPTMIARTLLYIAICIQQLPPEFDTSSLQMCRQSSILDVAEGITSTVATVITTNDTLSTSMPGLDCLLLQGLFHLNAGHLQRSWITVRRAISVAQLLNLQADFLRPLTEENLMTQMANRVMWQKVVQLDRYLGMIMGLPSGTGDDCFGDREEDFNDLNADREGILERKLCIVTGALSKRNQIQDTKDYTSTQRIDERMDHLYINMSHSWWEIPQLEVVDRINDSGQFDRIFAQIWFFQLRSLLHLPFLLREDQNNNFEYSRLSCVNASRAVILRYLAIRRVRNTQIMCKVLDFAAFIACVIMILDQLRSRYSGKELIEPPPSAEKRKDGELIQEIISSMELISRSEREVVVRESVEVLKTLLDTNTSSKKLRLTIPYIGTISVLREQQQHHNNETPVQHPRKYSISSIIDHQNPVAATSMDNQGMAHASNVPNSGDWQSTVGHAQAYSPSPFLSFDPSFEEDQMVIQGWEPEPLEEIFFYSMMGSDVNGEWIF